MTQNKLMKVLVLAVLFLCHKDYSRATEREDNYEEKN
jgi:hypothetical protein